MEEITCEIGNRSSRNAVNARGSVMKYEGVQDGGRQHSEDNGQVRVKMDNGAVRYRTSE